MASIHEIHQRISTEVRKVVLGQDRLTDLCMVGLLSGGHVLLEGVPGTAKTLLMRTLAHILGVEFTRIQFTPDLMPSDVIGTNIFNFQTNQFILKKGPIFTQFLLADEINRTPPKTQAALLEAMQEGNVTLDGKTHSLSKVFIVAATQNPIEQEGTYPLPEAQLDRFLFKLQVPYPSHKAENAMVKMHQRGLISTHPEEMGVRQIIEESTILAMREKVNSILVADAIIDYIVTIVRKTREHPMILSGASPRSALMLTGASRSYAILHNREYVIPDDVKNLAESVLGHRIILTPNAHIEGTSVQKVLASIVAGVEIPR